MRELASFTSYLIEREIQRRKRPKKTLIKPLKEIPEEEAQCVSCGAELADSELFRHYRVCEFCGFHHTISARERIYLLVDPASFQEFDRTVPVSEPVQFLGDISYQERIREAQRRTGLPEAVVTGTCTIGGNPAVLAVLDFGFLGGNMGMTVGEKIARGFELAAKRKLPIITVVSSGGARIEEGVLSLMQMAKTAAAAKRFQNYNLPHICILTNPTTGEVYASFANLADIIIAEPKALIGFAPLRTVEQATEVRSPESSHTAESHLEHGLIDQIVDRTRLRHLLSIILDLLSSRYQLGTRERVRPYFAPTHPQEQAWQTVQLARHQARPTTLDYITRIASVFVELHGDRSYGDDPAIVCGLAEIGGEAVMIIGQQRDRNQGRAGPEGFRKAQRAMKLAAKFKLPLITFIDTPGAYSGPGAEERGIGNAIASTLALMSDLPTPILSVIIGEGGSEGALALGIADRTLMLENAFLSVVSPERAASIFYRDIKKAEELASALRLTPADCKRLGIVDAIVPEPEGGAHTDHAEAARLLKNLLLQHLLQIHDRPPEKLAKSRYHKFRHVGGPTSLVKRVASGKLAQLQSLLQPGG